MMKRWFIAALLCVSQSAASALAATTPAPLEDHVVWYGTPGTRAYVQPALDVWQKLHPNTTIDVVEGNGPDLLEHTGDKPRPADAPVDYGAASAPVAASAATSG